MNKPRVLLVDDGLSVLDALGIMIESEGFELVRAADGHEAVEKFRQQPIDIVQLDLNMPVKGGWDTLERLTTINPLPIVVITARSDAFRLRWTRASPR
jgi:CheY-like chemotaxis protein